MFNPKAVANGDVRSEIEHVHSGDARPLAIAIVTDDHTTAQALATACEFMPAFDCRVRIAALRDDPAHLRPQPDEVLILDTANARDRRLDPSRYAASPCVSVIHATEQGDDADEPQSHATILYADLSPTALEVAVRAAQRNCRALMTARRAQEAAERSALAASDGRRRILEEIGPIAHALEGLLDIISAEENATGGAAAMQFGLLRNWTRDLMNTVARHQDAAAIPVGAEAELGAIVEDAVALFRCKSDGLGHTVVLSSPSEPVVVRADPRRLQTAVRQLIESVLDRETRDRRIDIVLWRSMEECRLAFVSGPPVRRGGETDEECAAPSVRPAGLADSRFVSALAQLRELGAVVESTCATATGSNLLISLPIA
ncbi:MAG: hypothetical protein KDJ25_08050 [Rhodoblastus sp.]|nr:hypothetical protein [Rhodoblastus sp.]